MNGKNGKSTSNGKQAKITGLIVSTLGLLIFLLGADPGLFGLDRSPVIGYVQVMVFSTGLLILTLGSSITLNSYWYKNGRSILADIGLRLAWTGLIISLASGMADLFGLGTRPLTESTTFFGYWQARGVLIGEIVIILGLLLMLPFKRSSPPPEKEDEASTSQ